MFESALGCGGWSQAGWQHPQAGIINLDADFLYPVQVKSSRPRPGKSLRGILGVSSCVGWGRGGGLCTVHGGVWVERGMARQRRGWSTFLRAHFYPLNAHAC